MIPLEFSVLISVYKNDMPLLFDRALNSIKNNSLAPAEIILVVDGPVSAMLNLVIYKYKLIFRQQLIIVRLSHNFGLAIALNIGLSHVKTSFVIRADADDFNLPERFAILHSYMQKGFDLIGSQIEEVDFNGTHISYRRVPIAQEEIESFSRSRNPFNHMTVCYKTSFVKALGGYPNLHLREDYGLWLNMLKSGAKVINIDSALVKATTGQSFYRRRGGFKSIKAEFNFQIFLVRNGFRGVFRSCLDFLVKLFIYLLPSGWRFYIYKFFLRNY